MSQRIDWLLSRQPMFPDGVWKAERRSRRGEVLVCSLTVSVTVVSVGSEVCPVTVRLMIVVLPSPPQAARPRQSATATTTNADFLDTSEVKVVARDLGDLLEKVIAP